MLFCVPLFLKPFSAPLSRPPPPGSAGLGGCAGASLSTGAIGDVALFGCASGALFKATLGSAAVPGVPDWRPV